MVAALEFSVYLCGVARNIVTPNSQCLISEDTNVSDSKRWVQFLTTISLFQFYTICDSGGVSLIATLLGDINHETGHSENKKLLYNS